MALIKVPTSFNIDVEFEIPEFYKRMLSLFIDMVLEIAYIYFVVKIYSEFRGYGYDEDNAFNLWAIQLLLFLPIAIYHLVLEITMNGQSIGKKIMGIRVVNENGGRPSFSQFVIRWLLRISDVWIISLLFIVASAGAGMSGWESGILVLLALGFLVTDIILVASSQKGQRIGDMLAKTILIRTKSKASIEETVFQEVEDSYTPAFPQIMRLSDRDINAIKSILQSSLRKNDYVMASAAADKIRNHLKIETDMDPQQFLEVLLKDYNYLSVK
ncbi:MAG: hypothetical protein DI535_15130 [Citrobacter freundii]|nr:MAG: hypothetical protein DI535_15130 [Citrobacter freundii]